MKIPDLSSEGNRWIALVFLALGLAIVIIDNTVINVAIPYILRDLNTTLDAIQWVISGYALIIATLLITVGRLGDMYGRKRIFLIGTVLFAIGSFIASFAQNPAVLFLGEAFIEAIGASMMLTSSLSLLAGEFQGKERAIAFGVWGSVAGASAAIGPLLGGFLTTYYSWRWSLRINVFVAIIAILGSVFIKEIKVGSRKFDFGGMTLSAIGLFSLIFAVIEGRTYGWWTPNQALTIGNVSWPFSSISIIPFIFIIAAMFIHLFVYYEMEKEKNGEDPLLKIGLFKNLSFSLGLITLGIVVLGQIGIFFVMPIYLQNSLGYDAFKTGLIFLPFSISSFIFGPLSGFLASRIGPKTLVSSGMIVISLGTFLLMESITATSTGLSLAPANILFGIGLGMASAQLTNMILSSVPSEVAGEASAVNATIRQVASSVGIALLGVVLASSITTNATNLISKDQDIPSPVKQVILKNVSSISFERGEKVNLPPNANPVVTNAVQNNIKEALVDSAKESIRIALVFTIIGAFLSLFLKEPMEKPKDQDEIKTREILIPKGTEIKIRPD